MTSDITVYHEVSGLSSDAPDRLEAVIQAWLYTKARRTGSRKTEQAYREAIEALRHRLQSAGLDLDGDPRAIALMAQTWAGQSTKPDHTVAAATYNQRLACLSSFYHFAKKQGLFSGENPISRVERRPVQGYAHAAGHEVEELKDKLKAIDRATLAGKRDYALLHVALNTGRRLSELAALRWGDLRFTGQRVILTWRRAKGGKVLSDRLPVRVTNAVIDYLHAAYGSELDSLPADAPVWVSLSPRNRKQALGIQTIADICEKRLGASKVHSLRHTFARMMEDAGAKVSDIQARLGHESLATTGRYLAALRQAENPHADDLAARLGVD